MSNKQPIVFISEAVNETGLRILEGKCTILQAPDTSKETALAMVGDADAVLLRATLKFDSELIDAAKKLKIISRTGVGVDNVDLIAAGRRGILVCNTPGTNDESVAEHTLSLVLAMAKQLFYMDAAVRGQNWKARFSPMQMEVKGKKIGLIGYGRTGKAVARLCKPFGMDILINDPEIENPDTWVRQAGIEEIFSSCDFVSLHCPSNDQTRYMVNKDLLQLMKPSSYLINTSRGDLIDEEALAYALLKNTIAGAAMDVFEEEPLRAGHPLLNLSNLILSPHVAGSTLESNERIASIAASAIVDVLEGRRPKYICNNQFLLNN
jgi:D-3-phosphoglycerate dehydrogenase